MAMGLKAKSIASSSEESFRQELCASELSSGANERVCCFLCRLDLAPLSFWAESAINGSKCA